MNKKPSYVDDSAFYHLYEHPLNERMRLFMRLEALLSQMNQFKESNGFYAIQAFLAALFDVIDFFHRYEIRAELLKEIQRLQSGFTHKAKEEDSDVYLEFIESLQHHLKIIHAINLNEISALRENELFNSLRQRNSTQSGHCLFEIPAYQFWLSQCSNQTVPFLQYCNDLFKPISEAVKVILAAVRGEDEWNEYVAENGMFLKTLEKGKTNQLLRIYMPQDSYFFPRVSGDNHRFSIRFMQQKSPAERATQPKEDVAFSLQICSV